MRNTWIALLKQPAAKVGIASAVMFQLIFSIVWMTGYDGVTDNAANMKVAIVNDDAGLGAKAAEGIGGALPFETVGADDLESAQQMLENRDVHMIVHIPADFTAEVSAAETKGTLEYYINESNPATVKNMMSGAAAGITAAVNRMAVQTGAQAALSAVKVPEQQAAAMAAGLSERVTGEFRYSHPVASMSKQMVPMMMVLASYVGSMLLAMNLEQASLAVSGRHSRWSRFAARQAINIGAALLVALVGTSLVTLLGGAAEQGFAALFLFQALFLFTFMTTAQVFVMLLGPGGMVFNIVMLSAQLVSSGAMVPRELLSDFYYGLGNAFPATYAVEGVMNLLFGGPGAAAPAAGLLWVLGGAFVLSVLAAAARREKRGTTALHPALNTERPAS
ncbi:YhgE/Pip domain-containing protein [Paenibacillus thermotolerans]|uniref:YhgE/Pip domain-containing protein n=1 Tax=Paenibacillus thermotolerans TaxID=3027807 RepID=UPI002368D9DF|nr:MULTISPECIES: ABC transporter permease [unclassified Paenibacillus]